MHELLQIVSPQKKTKHSNCFIAIVLEDSAEILSSPKDCIYIKSCSPLMKSYICLVSEKNDFHDELLKPVINKQVNMELLLNQILI